MPRSNDVILVLNAGSSSIKLSVFAEGAGELALELRGEIEGLYTAPRFVAHDPSGRVVAERSWRGTTLGHDGALEYLSDFLKHNLADHRLVGVGHRVVHGGLDYTAPVRVDAETLKALGHFIPLAPLHQPHNLSPIALMLARAPELPLGSGARSRRLCREAHPWPGSGPDPHQSQVFQSDASRSDAGRPGAP